MKCIVIGASAAGMSAAKTLREIDDNIEITLISKDENVYSRCILHHYISNHRTIEELNFTDKDFFYDYRINWLKGVEVVKIDDTNRKIVLSNKDELEYDKVIIASGASSFMPPVKGLREGKNVVGLRNLDDAILIKEKVKQIKSVVIIGAGLVGIDALTGLLDYDIELSLVEMSNKLLPLQLDEYTSKVYKDAFEAKNVNIKLNVTAQELILDEDNNPKELLLNTGEKIPCELVIVATGIRANIAFLEGSNIECDRFGLIIDDKCQTSSADVYGCGDVTGRNPIWPTAIKEGIIAAKNVLGKKAHMNDFFGSKNTMNFLSIPTMSLGMVEAEDETYIVETKITEENYKKIIHKDGKIYGAIIQGDLSYAGVLTQLIKENIDISEVKKDIFDIDYADFFNLERNLEFSYN